MSRRNLPSTSLANIRRQRSMTSDEPLHSVASPNDSPFYDPVTSANILHQQDTSFPMSDSMNTSSTSSTHFLGVSDVASSLSGHSSRTGVNRSAVSQQPSFESYDSSMSGSSLPSEPDTSVRHQQQFKVTGGRKAGQQPQMDVKHLSSKLARIPGDLESSGDDYVDLKGEHEKHDASDSSSKKDIKSSATGAAANIKSLWKRAFTKLHKAKREPANTEKKRTSSHQRFSDQSEIDPVYQLLRSAATRNQATLASTSGIILPKSAPPDYERSRLQNTSSTTPPESSETLHLDGLVAKYRSREKRQPYVKFEQESDNGPATRRKQESPEGSKPSTRIDTGNDHSDTSPVNSSHSSIQSIAKSRHPHPRDASRSNRPLRGLMPSTSLVKSESVDFDDTTVQSREAELAYEQHKRATMRKTLIRLSGGGGDRTSQQPSTHHQTDVSNSNSSLASVRSRVGTSGRSHPEHRFTDDNIGGGVMHRTRQKYFSNRLKSFSMDESPMDQDGRFGSRLLPSSLSHAGSKSSCRDYRLGDPMLHGRLLPSYPPPSTRSPNLPGDRVHLVRQRANDSNHLRVQFQSTKSVSLDVSMGGGGGSVGTEDSSEYGALSGASSPGQTALSYYNKQGRHFDQQQPTGGMLLKSSRKNVTSSSALYRSGKQANQASLGRAPFELHRSVNVVYQPSDTSHYNDQLLGNTCHACNRPFDGVKDDEYGMPSSTLLYRNQSSELVNRGLTGQDFQRDYHHNQLTTAAPPLFHRFQTTSRSSRSGHPPDYSQIEKSRRYVVVEDFCTQYQDELSLRLVEEEREDMVFLFACLQTRAIHIEATTSLTTDSFIMALMRFIGRRGCPRAFYSDNETNLVGATRELRKALE